MEDIGSKLDAAPSTLNGAKTGVAAKDGRRAPQWTLGAAKAVNANQG